MASGFIVKSFSTVLFGSQYQGTEQNNCIKGSYSMLSKIFVNKKRF